MNTTDRQFVKSGDLKKFVPCVFQFLDRPELSTNVFQRSCLLTLAFLCTVCVCECKEDHRGVFVCDMSHPQAIATSTRTVTKTWSNIVTSIQGRCLEQFRKREWILDGDGKLFMRQPGILGPVPVYACASYIWEGIESTLVSSMLKYVRFKISPTLQLRWFPKAMNPICEILFLSVDECQSIPPVQFDHRIWAFSNAQWTCTNFTNIKVSELIQVGSILASVDCAASCLPTVLQNEILEFLQWSPDEHMVQVGKDASLESVMSAAPFQNHATLQYVSNVLPPLESIGSIWFIPEENRPYYHDLLGKPVRFNKEPDWKHSLHIQTPLFDQVWQQAGVPFAAAALLFACLGSHCCLKFNSITKVKVCCVLQVLTIRFLHCASSLSMRHVVARVWHGRLCVVTRRRRFLHGFEDNDQHNCGQYKEYQYPNDPAKATEHSNRA